MGDRGSDRTGRRGQAEDLAQLAREAIVTKLRLQLPILLGQPGDGPPGLGERLAIVVPVNVVRHDASTVPRPAGGVMSRPGHSERRFPRPTDLTPTCRPWVHGDEVSPS